MQELSSKPVLQSIKSSVDLRVELINQSERHTFETQTDSILQVVDDRLQKLNHVM